MNRDENSLIQKYLNRKDFTKADALITKLLQEDNNNAEAHYFRGTSSFFQGNLSKAIEHLKRTLELEPKHTDAAICLSVLYNDIGRYQDAKGIFEKANQSVIHTNIGDDPEIDRKFAVKHLELGDMYFRYRRYEESIEEYGKASFLDPLSIDTNIKRAKAYAKKGYFTRAIQDLQQLKIQHPRHTPIRIQLGLLHYSQGNILDAELEWESILDFAPNHREALSYLEMAKKDRIKI